MPAISNYIELASELQRVRKRPGMYIGEPNLKSLYLLLIGIDIATDLNITGGFYDYLSNKYRTVSALGWPYLVEKLANKEGSASGERQVELAFELLYEFFDSQADNLNE